eukprot:GHVR01044862.1.p1 GENE.GHVR01044862.1~~GHVR01044862.1.p1  ORF type:complete len:117 (+),score=10.17 GHVR01044862.1:4641-4991(+)
MMKLDVVNYIDYSFFDKAKDQQWISKQYRNHYRIGGMKISLDGSPQGRTAWRTIPYLIPPHFSVKDKDYKGYPSIPKDEDVLAIYDQAFKDDIQILTHANGDAAIDQMIRTMKSIS